MDAKEKGIMLLKTTTAVDMNAAAKTILYPVPAGKRCIVTMVVLRDPSGTLDGCDDVDFGTGAACATQSFLNAVTGITDMTATTDYMILRQACEDAGVSDPDEYTIIDGDAAAAVDREFGIYPVDGADAANTATIDVFGYLFDS